MSAIVGEVDITAHIERLVAEAPPLTDAQRLKLRSILTPCKGAARQNRAQRAA